MRIFQMLCRSRKPQNPKCVPLAKPRLNFALKNRVCTKKTGGGKGATLQELQNLISALARNEFNTQACQKEIIALRDAETAAYQQLEKEKMENRSDKIKPGAQLSAGQLNNHLKRFPIRETNKFEENMKRFLAHLPK